MARRIRSLVLALAVSPLVLLAAGAAASADGGACDPRPDRPSCTILRPVVSSGARITAPGAWGQECLVVVGGLGSPTDASDADFFGAVLGGLRSSIDHRLIRFGVDRGSYDTAGAISRSGDDLRAVIHGISADCKATSVLAHSMGGAVVDRAFSKGDPAADGVVTYVALASPHNGANAARSLRPAIEADPLLAAGASLTAQALQVHDPTSAAVRDLARIRAPRPVRDLEAVRLRLVTDAFVLRRDNVDRRVDVREYRPTSAGQAADGHGHIVENEVVQRVVRATIRSHHVPPEERTVDEVQAAERASVAIDAALAGLEDDVRLGLLGAAQATRSVAWPISLALPPVE